MTTLASGEHGPLVIASYAERLYWGTSESGTTPVIRAMDKTGGTAATLVAVPRQLQMPGGINYRAWIDTLQVDANWIFFLACEAEAVPNPDDVASMYDLQTFYRAPRSGGTAEAFEGPDGFVLLEQFGRMAAPLPPEDGFIYYLSEDQARTGIDIAAVPKAGGASSVVRLQVPDSNWYSIFSMAKDGDHWYVSHDNYFGAAHMYCVSRAPKTGGVFEDVWCPDFIPVNLLPAPGRLFAVNPWHWATAPGSWSLSVATGRPSPVAGSDNMIRKIAADASAATLYAIEVSYGSEIPPVPGTWDAVRTDVVTGQRTLLYRSGVQSSGSGAGLIVDARAIFFAHDGDVLRVEQ